MAQASWSGFFLKDACDVLVDQAGDEGLVGDVFSGGLALDSGEVVMTQANVDALVFPKSVFSREGEHV